MSVRALRAKAVGRWERGCVTEDRVWFSWLRSRRSLRGALHVRGAGIVFGGNRRLSHPGFGKVSPRHADVTLTCASRRPSPRRTTTRIVTTVIIAASRAVALGARRGADAGARPCRRQCQHRLERGLRRHGRHVSGFGSSSVVAEARRYLGGNPDRPRQPVVRALHEHGVAAHRLSRHRLGHGAFVRQLRPARLRSAGRRHRRDGHGAAAAMSASSAASMPRAIRSWSRATTATGSGKRRFRAAGSTPTYADELRLAYVSPRFTGRGARASRAVHTGFGRFGYDRIADADGAAGDHLGIDAAFVVAEAAHQRLRDVEVARGGVRDRH